jgi:hypothetical protein
MTDNMKYHIDNKKPLTENTFRYGSKAFLDLWAEARFLYSRNAVDAYGLDKEIITETKLGEYGMFEGQMVPLDLPMLEEGGADTSWTDEEGNKITLQDILDLTKAIPQKDYPTEKLAKIVLNWDDNPEEIERIEQVEVSKQYPILIMVDERGEIQWILDGNHRAQKAIAAGLKSIPAKLVNIKKLPKEFQDVLSEAKKETLRTWFKRSGPKGKEGGWVDCNTCKDGSCKACGRKKGEKRSKYPSCRPTPAQCKSPGKGTKWGKTK